VGRIGSAAALRRLPDAESIALHTAPDREADTPIKLIPFGRIGSSIALALRPVISPVIYSTLDIAVGRADFYDAACLGQ
jgi:hypothetical protein